MDTFIKCYYCTIQFPNKSTYYLMNHLRAVHQLGFRGMKALMHCGDCTFTTFTSRQFSRHITKYHGPEATRPVDDIHGISLDASTTNNAACFGTLTYRNETGDVTGLPMNEDIITEGRENECRDNQEYSNSGPFSHEELDENLDTFISRFILELYSKGSTTRAQVQCVVDGAASLIESIMDVTLRKCKHVLNGHSDLKQTIVGIFHSHSNPFVHYRTDYLRTKSLAEKGLVEPRDVVIGTRLDSCGQQGVSTVNSTVQYVPLQQTLELLYSKEEFCQAIRSTPCKHRPGIYTLQQTNPLYKAHPNALKLAVYNDDIEVGNPLGSKSGINKLTMYYYMIMNIPNHSSLSSIHLALIAYASDVKEYGHAQVLRPFIEDLKKLETGIQLNGQGVDRKVFGTVVSLPADNLAANETQGFVGSFSANYYCRFCKMHNSVAQRATSEDVSLLRTKGQQASDLRQVCENRQSVSQHGVKSACVFDELMYFNAVDSFTPDCMHDIFEGVARRELSLVIKEFVITQKFLTLTTLNSIIRSYDYGRLDTKNKPSPVLVDKGEVKIRQTASQTWCLLRLLSFMIGHLVPEGNPKWEVILYLRDIVDHIFSPYDTVGSTYALADLIETHHTEYLKEFQEQNLTPKHHFLIHYGEAIRRNGPLSEYWCMRFEAKHKMAKLVASASCNFINMPKTLATRYQLAAFHHWSAEVNLISQPTIYNSKANVVTSIDIHGLPYQPGMVVCCGMDDNGTPEIRMISTLGRLDRGPIANCWTVYTRFDSHCRAYEIVDIDKSQLITIELNQLSNPFPMDVLYKGSSKMISKKVNFV